MEDRTKEVEHTTKDTAGQTKVMLTMDKITTGKSKDEITMDKSKDEITTGKSKDEITTGKSKDEIATGKSKDEITTGKSKDEIITGKSKDEITVSKSKDEIAMDKTKDKSNPGKTKDNAAGITGDKTSKFHSVSAENEETSRFSSVGTTKYCLDANTHGNHHGDVSEVVLNLKIPQMTKYRKAIALVLKKKMRKPSFEDINARYGCRRQSYGSETATVGRKDVNELKIREASMEPITDSKVLKLRQMIEKCSKYKHNIPIETRISKHKLTERNHYVKLRKASERHNKRETERKEESTHKERTSLLHAPILSLQFQGTALYRYPPILSPGQFFVPHQLSNQVNFVSNLPFLSMNHSGNSTNSWKPCNSAQIQADSTNGVGRVHNHIQKMPRPSGLTPTLPLRAFSLPMEGCKTVAVASLQDHLAGNTNLPVQAGASYAYASIPMAEYPPNYLENMECRKTVSEGTEHNRNLRLNTRSHDKNIPDEQTQVETFQEGKMTSTETQVYAEQNMSEKITDDVAETFERKEVDFMKYSNALPKDIQEGMQALAEILR
jgi:hypothetical protein